MQLDLVGDELDQIDSIWGRTRWGQTRHGAKPAATERSMGTKRLVFRQLQQLKLSAEFCSKKEIPKQYSKVQSDGQH